MRLCSLTCLATLLALPAFAATEDELWAQAKSAARSFEQTVGVPVVWLEGDPAKGQAVTQGIIAFPPTALDAATSTPALLAELSAYPKDFLKRSGLKRLLVARGLERNGQPWGGFAIRSGPQTGTLLVSLGSLSWAAIAIHHEVFHLTQLTSPARGKLSGWRSCNPSGFVYASDGLIDRSRARVATITEYAQTNVEEDQAETFAWALVDAAFVEQQSKQDEGIACKVKLVREAVKAVDSSFDADRWSRLAKRLRGEALP
ncbi:MAG: hypothetical protein GQE15_01370 [Archangiaceae bacterium]|nr:hypothetical protein [Archangiaceae bacterium]